MATTMRYLSSLESHKQWETTSTSNWRIQIITGHKLTVWYTQQQSVLESHLRRNTSIYTMESSNPNRATLLRLHKEITEFGIYLTTSTRSLYSTSIMSRSMWHQTRSAGCKTHSIVVLCTLGAIKSNNSTSTSKHAKTVSERTQRCYSYFGRDRLAIRSFKTVLYNWERS